MKKLAVTKDRGFTDKLLGSRWEAETGHGAGDFGMEPAARISRNRDETGAGAAHSRGVAGRTFDYIVFRHSHFRWRCGRAKLCLKAPGSDPGLFPSGLLKI